jgi:hypothetical protein
MEKETGQSKLLSTIKSIIDPKQLISPGCFVK